MKLKLTLPFFMLLLLAGTVTAAPFATAVHASKDSCDTPYKLKDIDLSSEELSGYLVLRCSFVFEKESAMPATVDVLARFTDCKGKEIFVQMKLSYDKSTGRYHAVQAIPQNKECPLTLAGFTITVKNPCGNVSSWEAEVQPTAGKSCCGGETKNTGYAFRVKYTRGRVL